MDYDLVIIGAGVIGLACAARNPERLKSVLVIERNDSFGHEVSSRNSEVIHAGIYYQKDSLKAKLCVKGNDSLYSWCDSDNVPYRKCGKYIISTSLQEETALYKIYEKGIQNGVKNLKLISKSEINKTEPNISGTMAILSPNTGIIDSHQLMKSFLKVSIDKGCDFAWSHSIVGVEIQSEGYTLMIEDPSEKMLSITAKNVINAAGLDSDKVAGLLGINIEENGYLLQYCRGHYFRIRSKPEYRVNHLIYSIPPNNNLGLGIHLTLDLNGELRLGPDTQILNDRVQDYNVPDDLKETFFEEAKNILKGLDVDDIYPDMAGIRPSIKRKKGEFKDFFINEEGDKGFENWVNLIGIESPGLTCCIEIADMCHEYLYN